MTKKKKNNSQIITPAQQAQVLDFLRVDLSYPHWSGEIPPACILSLEKDVLGKTILITSVVDSFEEYQKQHSDGFWGILVSCHHSFIESDIDRWESEFGEVLLDADRFNLLNGITKAAVLYSEFHWVSKEAEEIRREYKIPLIEWHTSAFTLTEKDKVVADLVAKKKERIKKHNDMIGSPKKLSFEEIDQIINGKQIVEPRTPHINLIR